MTDQRLRKSFSDISDRINKFEILEHNALNSIQEVKEVECKCCGLKEDCTINYISKIEDTYAGTWVCGLCSEAVKDRVAASNDMQEALISHRDFCQKFNITRVNPKLSYTRSMRNIAKRCCEIRNLKNMKEMEKLPRASSCVPRILDSGNG